jgi:hypothetical protein
METAWFPFAPPVRNLKVDAPRSFEVTRIVSILKTPADREGACTATSVDGPTCPMGSVMFVVVDAALLVELLDAMSGTALTR